VPRLAPATAGARNNGFKLIWGSKKEKKDKAKQKSKKKAKSERKDSSNGKLNAAKPDGSKPREIRSSSPESIDGIQGHQAVRASSQVMWVGVAVTRGLQANAGAGKASNKDPDVVDIQSGDETSEDAYLFYDAGSHWCRTCNVLCGTLYEIFDHVHSAKHKAVRPPRPHLPCFAVQHALFPGVRGSALGQPVGQAQD